VHSSVEAQKVHCYPYQNHPEAQNIRVFGARTDIPDNSSDRLSPRSHLVPKLCSYKLGFVFFKDKLSKNGNFSYFLNLLTVFNKIINR